MRNNKFLFGFMSAMLVAAAIVVVAGCGTVDNQVDSKQTYALAAQTFGNMLQDYNDAYDNAPAEVQMKWRLNVDPYIRYGYTALLAWHLAIDAEDEPQKKLAYEKAFADMVGVLVGIGVIEVKRE